MVGSPAALGARVRVRAPVKEGMIDVIVVVGDLTTTVPVGESP